MATIKERQEKLLKKSLYTKYYNCNPKDKINGDCVYRALSLFLDVSWEKVAEMEADFYLRTGQTFQTVSYIPLPIGAYIYSALDLFLRKDLGCTQFFNANIRNKALAQREDIAYNFSTIDEFIEKFAEQDKTYLFFEPHHVTTVKDMKIWDTDDHARMWPVYGFFR